jgi:hypothetical protein
VNLITVFVLGLLAVALLGAGILFEVLKRLKVFVEAILRYFPETPKNLPNL